MNQMMFTKLIAKALNNSKGKLMIIKKLNMQGKKSQNSDPKPTGVLLVLQNLQSVPYREPLIQNQLTELGGSKTWNCVSSIMIRSETMQEQTCWLILS